MRLYGISEQPYDQRKLRQQTRKKKSFLWLPMTIDKETRWFERAQWEEYYHAYSELNRDMNYWRAYKWIN